MTIVSRRLSYGARITFSVPVSGKRDEASGFEFHLVPIYKVANAYTVIFRRLKLKLSCPFGHTSSFTSELKRPENLGVKVNR